MVRSLNLIEPHVGPDLRSTLSVDPGAAGYEPRNPYASSAGSASAETHAVVLKTHRVSEPAGRPTARYEPLSLRNNTILRSA